jgi:two-component system, chemotaxis family, CheB/CheR fusion protein
VLLAEFAPPSMLITERGELMYTHGRVGQFFEPAAGEPTHNAFNMAREGLRLELPALVRRTAASEQPVMRRGLQVKTNGGFSVVNLSARKLTEPETLRGAILLSFELEQRQHGIEPEPEPNQGRRRGKRQRPEPMAELEHELQHMRDNLQGTIEELETSNEELKSTNEELQSTNEELQSANEELETSREEMQSLNEELHTVNAELEERNRALREAADDMQNLLNSIDIATLFLDGDLAIRRFTPPAKKVFSLIDADVGRPISDLAANLRYERLVEDARGVLDTLVFCEREIQTKDGSWRQMRIMPYRTHDNAIDGLVLTFVDIDHLKRAEQLAQVSRAFAEEVIDNLSQGVALIGEDLQVVSANRAFCSMFRVDSARVVGAPIARLLETSLGEAEAAARLREILAERDGDGGRIEAKLARGDGAHDLLVSLRHMRPEAGRLGHMILTVETSAEG